MVSLSAHQPSQGADGGIVFCLPVCVCIWLEKNAEETVGVLAVSGKSGSLEICVHTQAHATQQEAHRVRKRWSFLKSFFASNLASSTLCVFSFSPSYSFIYIPFLILA